MRPIQRVLIANRGEIACRIARTCRAMGISTVAVFSDADADLPHVRVADQAVRIGPGPSVDSYLRTDRILDAAARTGADAIHPGFGFLAENAEFADAVGAAGRIFIGPSAQNIRDLGSKARARALAEAAGVPTVPGFHDDDGDDDAFCARARELPFPVLIKASAGGGGKGMQIVREPGELAEAVASARRVARSAFGDDRLLAERYIEQPRHIEVQVLGDTHGHVIHLLERECSIQRRYQKIVEESPSPALDDAGREAICGAAVRLARSLGYFGAGTVEFILAPDGAFYFLEVNTRLQVEHPVTEAITGIDIVREQIRVARGERLGIAQSDVRAQGHAIEVRLYAEIPHRDFAPSTGTISRLAFPCQPGLRVDTGVESGSEVSPFYDPMLAKLIAHGATRSEAIDRMVAALEQTTLAGVHTNRSLLVDVLRTAAFGAGDTHTHFLQDRAELLAPPSSEAHARAATLAALAGCATRRCAPDRSLPSLPPGFSTNPGPPVPRRFEIAGESLWLGWRWLDATTVETSMFAPVETALPHEIRSTERWKLVAWDGERLTVESDEGLRLSAACVSERDPWGSLRWWIRTHDWNGLVEQPTPFLPPSAAVPPGGCTAPMPGRITAMDVEAGQAVHKGDRLMTLEAMKMEQAVRAPVDGVVREVLVKLGDQVEADAVLAVVEPAE